MPPSIDKLFLRRVSIAAMHFSYNPRRNMERFPALRAFVAVFIALSALAASPSQKTSAIASEVLSDRSRLEEDLRILCDEVGGRPTGSMAYGAALEWGLEAFRRAKVDSVALEAYDAPARWEPVGAEAEVLSPVRFPLRIVSFGNAPSTPEKLEAVLVDAGNGSRADFAKLGPRAHGAIALVRTKPMLSFDDLFAEYLAGPEMVRAAEASRVAAVLRGSEKPEEIVLLGAHLDSWDLGTGALDNGVNSALVVEVARAIAAGPRPKRTVRFVLFTGEEDGLLGSHGYVAAHRAEMDRYDAVLIHDIGDGKILGYFTDGRPELHAALSRVLAPVEDWAAAGLNDGAMLGTDNFDFLLEGVPNLIANQETAKYLPDYHAESDTFDKVDVTQARRNAAIAAVAVSGIANAPARLGKRQSRAEIEQVLTKSGIADQMKNYGLWTDWETGKRGRK